MSTIKLNLRRDKMSRAGLSPIELIYQISGKRKYYNTGIKIPFENWDNDHQLVIFTRKGTLLKTEVLSLNEKLNRLRKKVYAIEESLSSEGISPAPELIIEQLKQPDAKKTTTVNVCDFIDKHIKQNKTTKVSVAVYRQLKNDLISFNPKISFDKISYQFFAGLQNFLINKNLANSTIAKRLSTLKTIISSATLHGIVVDNNYKAFKLRRETLPVIALNEQDFQKLFDLGLTDNKRLSDTRDIFCFACVSGLRFSDLQQLKREHIREDQIVLTIRKTREPHRIPLNNYSKTILARYADDLRPLPMFSSQNLNYAIKDLCKYAGINEPVEIVKYRGNKREVSTLPKYELISLHSGRRTFATLSLKRGMLVHEVMAIGGWKDYKSFARYIAVTEDAKQNAMEKAWDKPKLQAVA